MNTSGLEVVRRYRELIREVRAEEAIAFLSEELEFVSPQGTLGYAELTQMLGGETDQVYRWKETGEVSNTEHRVMLWRVENGKIRYMKFFLEPEKAWAEAGVERP